MAPLAILAQVNEMPMGTLRKYEVQPSSQDAASFASTRLQLSPILRPDAPHNAIEEASRLLSEASSIVEMIVLLKDTKGSKKLAAFGTGPNAHQWLLRLPADLARAMSNPGKPVPFNYGCFPQTYRDPEKAKAQQTWRQTKLGAPLRDRLMTFTKLPEMMTRWMCCALSHQEFAAVRVGLVATGLVATALRPRIDLSDTPTEALVNQEPFWAKRMRAAWSGWDGRPVPCSRRRLPH